MYLRHTTRVKDGKAHTYWRLVRSVRVGRKVRAADRGAARRARRRGPRPGAGAGAQRSPASASSRTCSRRSRRRREPVRGPAGSRPAGARPHLRRRLAGLDAVAGPAAGHAAGAAAARRPRRRAVGDHGRVLVLARLCEPSSELHIAEDWYRRTALDDLLALPAPAGQRRPLLSRAGSPAARTRRRWSSIWSARSASSSRSTTICSSTT